MEVREQMRVTVRDSANYSIEIKETSESVRISEVNAEDAKIAKSEKTLTDGDENIKAPTIVRS